MKRPAAMMIKLFWLSLCLVTVPAASAQETTPEKRIKAAFLYKFSLYVEWPDEAFAGPADPIVIGVVGDIAIAKELQRVTAGRDVKQRPLQVRFYRDDITPAGVHLLYIDGRDGATRQTVLERLQDKPVLLVTDDPGGLATGSSVNFVVEGDRVRFDISLIAAEAQQLRISSRLLAVARQVRRAQP
jgi:hypothetical protein